MTDTDPPDDPPVESDDDRPPADAPAAVHRRLSDAGVRLNEAQAHLSGVRTQATRSDLDDEVALAEGAALVRSLEQCRDRLDDALAVAEQLTADETSGDRRPDESDDGDDEGDETPDRSGSSMLWNTVPADAPGRSS